MTTVPQVPCDSNPAARFIFSDKQITHAGYIVQGLTNSGKTLFDSFGVIRPYHKRFGKTDILTRLLPSAEAGSEKVNVRAGM